MADLLVAPSQPRHSRALHPTRCHLAVLAALSAMAAPAPAAQPGAVLAPGTIPVLRGLVSDYATSATFSTAAAAGGGQALTITQLKPRITLDWKQFDIGSASSVRFDQPSTSAIALNRIYDQNPSTIQGKLLANGQVYLVNQNGILFDRGAQVDVNTLIASTLNISDTVFSGALTQGHTFTPAFSGGYDAQGNTVAGAKTGSIEIGSYGPAGAAAPRITASGGGTVAILAPVVNNTSGLIAAPDGQVILAAGNSVYLDFSTSDSTSLRGMLVQVTADQGPVNLSSLIANSGSLSAERGNVTLAGLLINQSGRVSASSAMLQNGSIYLQGNTLNDERRGKVNLAAGSVTETPLDLSDTTTLRASDSYTPYQSVVNITGAQIVNEGRITSPGGKISLDALDPASKADARIYLAPGSVIDASGAWSSASAASNLLTFKVTSNELANAPDQKGGLLQGTTVTVNLAAGSNVLDLSGYQQARTETLAQKASVGGSVSLKTSGSLIARTDSTIDVSGGGVHYSAATLDTTQLIGADGKVYDIATAPEALPYVAIADSYTQKQPRWGYNQTYTNPASSNGVAQPAYTQGAAAGSVQISMGKGGNNGLVLDGNLQGGTTVGSQQRSAAPAGGVLTVGFFDGSVGSGAQDFGIGNVAWLSGVLSSLPAGFGASSALPDGAKSQLNLSTGVFGRGSVDAQGDYVTQGFGTVNLYANGLITVPRGVALQGPLGGTLGLHANQVAIDGSISVPAGKLTAEVLSTPGTAASPLSASSVVLGSGGSIDASGAWINSLVEGQTSALPSAVLNANQVGSSTLDGGSVTLAGPVVRLAERSVVAVNAGGSVSASGVASGAAGGSLSLQATGTAPLVLAGSLQGYGFGNGGALSLSTGGAARIGGGSDATYALNLDPTFFATGGFDSYAVAASGNLTLSAGSLLKPQVTTWQLANAQALALPSGAGAAAAALPVLLPDATRPATALSLSSSAALVLQPGSRIEADAGAAVKLSGATGVALGGSVSAPGGSIAVSLAVTGDAPIPPVLELASGATLSTRGVFVAAPNDQGLVQGSLRAGGSVTLTAQKAAIQLDPGSGIDVSGASQVVDQLAAQGAAQPYEKVLLNSNAGTLRISGNDSITLGGALLGQASGNAAGGAFSLALSERGDLFDPFTKRRIVVTQGGTPVAADAAYKDAPVSVSKLISGGFDKLALQSEDQILFANDATLRFTRGVSLNAQLLNVANDAQVAVSGAKVTLANTIGQRVSNDPSNPTSRLDPSLPSLPQPTGAGQGSFSAAADTLGVIGRVTIGGTQAVSLAATHDIQLSGRTVGDASTSQGATLDGGLVTAGNLSLQAAQVYPTTASNFGIAVADGLSGTRVAGGRITIGSSGGTRGAVYSAGGSLSLDADFVTQNGVLLAPLGRLNLTAGSALDLGAQSVTSVSANGLTIPYGETQAGVTWTYAATRSDATTGALTAPPSKQLQLTAPSITARSGSTIDVSGGGDVAAVEFVPGSGGSTNVLVQSNTYAIIPAARLGSAPVDPDIALAQNLGFGNIGSVYDSVRIGAGGVVPAGNYLLLPGYYALLPGAYMVQLLTGSSYSKLKAGQTVTLTNGQTVVPGVMTTAGTSVAAQNTVGVLLRSGSEIAKLADYQVTKSAYFADRANANGSTTPRLPGDGGQLTIQASQALSLNGTLSAALVDSAARAAEVDIAADRIALVDQAGNPGVPAGYLQIDAGSLSKLGASLLVGGTRSEAGGTLTITPTASDILVANGSTTTLSAPELVLAATDSITFKAGSSVASASGAGTKTTAITIGGSNATSGALVRVANSDLASVVRPSGNATRGSVVIESGAQIASSGSLTIDATLDTRSAGQISVATGGALSLVSGHLSLGDALPATGTIGGLALSNSEMAGFGQLGTLALRSYGGLDVYGAAVIGSADKSLGRLVVDAASFSGQAGTAPSLALNAQNVELLNSGAAPGAARTGGSDAGSFSVNAKQITLGAGDKAIGGFAVAQFNASASLLASGTGTLTVAAPLQLQASRIDSRSGASQQWSAAADPGSASPTYFPVTIAAPAAPVVQAPSGAIGSQLRITGASVSDAAPIVMKGGGITLQALGSQPGADVQLLGPALLDAGGTTKDFQGTLAVADAGQVTLSAPNGNVTMDGTARIDVAPSATGGSAGTLVITAQGAVLGGTLAGGGAGRFSLDVGSLGDFSALNRQLAQAGFGGALDIRQRSGDLVVAASDVVKAGQIVLEADAGTLSVSGRLDASAALGGGSVALYGRGVTLAPGALVDASATSTQVDTDKLTVPYANGGSVKVVAENGPLVFASGAQIDVRSGAKGQAGNVLLRAPRGTQGTGLNAALSGQVLSQRNGGSAAEVDVEGNRVYTLAPSGAVVGQAQISAYAQDNTRFMASPVATAIVGDDGVSAANVHVRPAVELQSAGDITLASSWDLTTGGWLIKPPGAKNAEAGSLALRAGGNLTLAGSSIGNPEDGLQPGATWNIALGSGADLTAANVLRTQSLPALAAQAAQHGTAQSGDLVLQSTGSVASVRTGTGSIEIAAGRDFAIQAGADPDTGNRLVGVVYTSGKAAIADPGQTIASPSDYRFAQGGGNVSVSAGRNATGAGDEWVTEWLRAATNGPASNGDTNQGVWWASRDHFHDGVAALGGGNVNLHAGQDIVNLSAWTPTSALLQTTADPTDLAQLGSGAKGTLVVFGGGLLDVRAGNNIVGGQYLVGRGSGRVSAGGSIGAGGVATGLLLMGASGDPALAQASLDVNAGGAVTLAGINNPGTLYQTSTDISEVPGYDGGDALRMLSLSSSSAVQVRAGGGDIRYGLNPLYADPLPEYADNAGALAQWLKVANITALPAHVNFSAFNGSIVNTAPGGQSVLFPSGDGALKLLAGKGIVSPYLALSDADPGQFGVYLEASSLGLDANDLLSSAARTSRLVANGSTDKYVNDLVALDGDITAPILNLPARSRLWASDDIVLPALKLQNLAAGDVSAVVADTGSIALASAAPTTIMGPGQLLLQAGRDLNLGSKPLVSYGNQLNTDIPDPKGATITLVAGLSGKLDLTAIDPGTKAWVLASEAGDKAAAQAAVQAMLGTTQVRSGNINTSLTSVQSNAGGGINLLAPGGNITVGLTTSDPTQVGLVTNAGGAIQSYLKGDFDINRGKVLTAQGGDISIYTSEGSIDAGRGAKTAVTTPPPVRTPIVVDGQVAGYTYSIPASVAGSGIQTATSKPSGPTSVAPKAGDIHLFAPAGTINAGEAGITSAGSIFVAALSIVNADNISAAGSSNAPVPQVGSVASTLAAGGGTTAADSAANAGVAAQAAAAAAQAAAAQAAASFRPNVLTVEVLGFGEKNCKESDKDCFAK